MTVMATRLAHRWLSPSHTSANRIGTLRTRLKALLTAQLLANATFLEVPSGRSRHTRRSARMKFQTVETWVATIAARVSIMLYWAASEAPPASEPATKREPTATASQNASWLTAIPVAPMIPKPSARVAVALFDVVMHFPPLECRAAE